MTGAAERQIRAADPGRSTWLSANAGSGKTRVLTDRVARLLLAEVPPQNILCLTYTKAAAGEMQNRLFQRLGHWSMLTDTALRAALSGIGVAGLDAPGLARARRLFASAIDTPGGLKIQTIHSFCAATLRRFPLEARVSPRFREIDERESRLLLREVFDSLSAGPEAAIVAEFARAAPGGDIEDLLMGIVGCAGGFETAHPASSIRIWYGLRGEHTPADLFAAILTPGLDGLVRDLTRVLDAGNKTDRGFAAKLARFSTDLPGSERFSILADTFLTKEGAKRSVWSEAAFRRRIGPLIDDAEALVDAVAEAAAAAAVHDAATRTIALHRFAHVFCRAYAGAKTRRGVLDFDDLIRGTLRLLSDPSVADWVLYRLDGGIDHILVDEAQDTSPAQWRIVERLAAEIASGAGRGGPRTTFAVGDKKQSIYSFQGADPSEFDRMQRFFDERLGAGGLQTLQLEHSFRSSPVILDLVDRVFAAGETPGVGTPPRHFAHFPDLPGRVDLWPLIPPVDAEEPPDWWDPRDRLTPRAHAAELAARLAAEVRRMVDAEVIPDASGGWRPVRPGDILILVRRRSFVSAALLLALKRQGLDVAGADQIVLASELAVMDVVSVLSVLVTPADSLALAEALRSPLFGWSEAQLYDAAHGRDPGETLWDALVRRETTFADTLSILRDLRSHADFLRPYETIMRLLVHHGGRKRLVARMGPAVEEALDVFLDQALAYEATDVPSLTGFLVWHAVDGVKVKRQTEAAGTRIRVMTVHGAKGLESPVVILPDTADEGSSHFTPLFRLPDGRPVWRPTRDATPATMADALAADAQRDEEENDRLLYVALTRAKCWLIVCGAGTDEKVRPSWHRLVSRAMDGTAPDDDGRLRLETPGWPRPERQATEAPAPEAPVMLPAWATEPAPPPPRAIRLLAPSGLGDMVASHEASLWTEGEDALHRGSQLHLLLEHLARRPEADWSDLAHGLLAEFDGGASEAEIADRLDEVRGILVRPDLAPLFAPDSLAEVGITAPIPGGARILGRIDRLIRQPGHVLAVDFKSNRLVPDRPGDVPAGILAQMGAYSAALQQLFPGDRVEVAILWTRTAVLMRLPDDIVAAALIAATTS